MIIRGGLNVYPREVEEVMMKHEAVSLVAVIGVAIGAVMIGKGLGFLDLTYSNTVWIIL